MTSETPATRLRRAREHRKVTRAQLAAKLGISQSTIRAHENGQNNVQPAIAEQYANELGVSPSWILYGVGEPVDQPAPTTTRIPVVGAIRPGFHPDRPFEAVIKSLEMALPGHENIANLKAYLNENPREGYTSYTICAPWNGEALYLVDDVVIRRSEGGRAEIDVWRVGAAAGFYVFFKGESQSRATEIMKVKAPVVGHIGGDHNFWVLGLVIGRLEYLAVHRIRAFRWPTTAAEDVT